MFAYSIFYTQADFVTSKYLYMVFFIKVSNPCFVTIIKNTSDTLLFSPNIFITNIYSSTWVVIGSTTLPSLLATPSMYLASFYAAINFAVLTSVYFMTSLSFSPFM